MYGLDAYDDPELFDFLVGQGGSSVAFYQVEARRIGGPVLELACGTGRLAIPLAKAGLATSGLDVHAEMLERARAKASEGGVSIDWVQGDMRDFSLGRTFGLIFIANNSLLHLHHADEICQCFRAVARHLRPGGLFIFEIFNPSPLLLSRPREVRFPVATFDHSRLGAVNVEQTVDYDSATQISRETWFWSTAENPDFRVRPFHLRNIFPQEVPLLVEQSGLRLIARYGNCDRSPFASDSRNQVCVCEVA